MSLLQQNLPARGAAASATLLRTSLGVMYLAHSIVLKVFTFGFAGTAGYFASLGLPAFTAYLVIAAEVTGGILLLANVATRWVPLALLPILFGALWAHSGNGWVFSASVAAGNTRCSWWWCRWRCRCRPLRRAAS
jgi:putative oxidoreductase